MPVPRQTVEQMIFESRYGRRFTQDSPVLPDVWIGYGYAPDESLDLLLTPDRNVSPGQLARIVAERLGATLSPRLHGIAYNQSTVAVRLHFHELVRIVLPLSEWWSSMIEVDPIVRTGIGSS